MTALVICRFAHFMAAMLAFGASAYLRLAAPEALRKTLAPAVRRLVAAASVIALATAILWLALEAASMAEDWSAATDPVTLLAVLTDTAFGHAWIAHLALAAALVVVAFAPGSRWTSIAIISAPDAREPSARRPRGDANRARRHALSAPITPPTC